MAAVIDLYPTKKIDRGTSGTADYYQAIEDAVDVSDYGEAAVLLTVYAGSVVSGGSITVDLQTAVDNRDDSYVKLKRLNAFTTEGTISGPVSTYMYFSGPGGADSGHPGFARYLRLHVSIDTDNAWITLGTKAVLKP